MNTESQQHNQQHAARSLQERSGQAIKPSVHDALQGSRGPARRLHKPPACLTRKLATGILPHCVTHTHKKIPPQTHQEYCGGHSPEQQERCAARQSRTSPEAGVYEHTFAKPGSKTALLVHCALSSTSHETTEKPFYAKPLACRWPCF